MIVAENHQDILPVQRVDQLDQQLEQDQWLIEGLWGRSAIGLIGGAPKCCKTWMGLDLAVSVATGTDAIGHFAVHATGSALIYLAEDALPQVRARIESLCRHRGLQLDALDLHVITAPVLRLDLANDQQRLARTIDRLEPTIVLLDPLVRMHRLDENSAAEISGLLGYIRDLQRNYDAAVVCAGFGGISLGSTPTAMANMAAVSQRYGASHLAFIIVPLVCAFFIDLANALLIPAFLANF